MGQKHCAFLTVYGQLFTYGNNSSGQLGLGHCDDQYLEPAFVEELCGNYAILNPFTTEGNTLIYRFMCNIADWRGIHIKGGTDVYKGWRRP